MDGKRWSRVAALVLGGVVFVYAVMYADVTMRAHESFLEGEKYMVWYSNPAQKQAYFEKQFEAGKAKLDLEHNQKIMTDDDYTARLASLQFEKNFNINESSLKYAYQWYKDTYELFSPPESKWVKAAREKAPEALALWKQELTAKHVPFDDYMFE